MAEAGGAETIDFSKTDVYDELMKRTGKRGPDSCIDAVGCEASGHGAADAVLDKVKAATFLATDRVHVLREAIMCCRKAGTISIPGVYVGMGDKIPLGAAMNKGLTIKTGQTHVQAYTGPLLKRIEAGEIDPSFVVTHPGQPRRRAGDVQEVSRQGRRCDQGGAAARSVAMARIVYGNASDPLAGPRVGSLAGVAAPERAPQAHLWPIWRALSCLRFSPPSRVGRDPRYD